MAEEGTKPGMTVHGNEYHDPDFEQEGAAAALVGAHEVKTTGIHGVGVSTVESASGSQGKVDTHKVLDTGVHNVGSNYVCQAPAASHLVRAFTKGWTANKLLKGAGVNADPTELSGWQVISEQTVTSDCEYIDFLTLDINTDLFYVLFGSFKNPQIENASLLLCVNADYTETHYYAQAVDVDGNVVTAVRYNTPFLGGIPIGNRLICMAYINRDPDGYPRHYSFTSRYSTNAVVIQHWGACKTATVTNITSLRILTGTAGGIGAGSFVVLCKPRTG